MVLQPFYQGSIWSTTLSAQTLIAHCPFIKGMVQYPVCKSKPPNPVSPNPQILSVQTTKPCQSNPIQAIPTQVPFFSALFGRLCTSTLPFTKDELVLVKNTSTHPFTKGGLAAGEPWCLFQFTLLPRGIDKFQRINSPSSS